MRDADVLLVGGKNTFHLMYWLKKTGLNSLLPKLLQTKVYVGISAGSMVPTPSLSLSQSKKLYYKKLVEKGDEKALGWVKFHLRPHLNSPWFVNVRAKILKEFAKEFKETFYALDDASALKVIDGEVSVVSEGKWKKFN